MVIHLMDFELTKNREFIPPPLTLGPDPLILQYKALFREVSRNFQNGFSGKSDAKIFPKPIYIQVKILTDPDRLSLLELTQRNSFG